jgi:hypothetical protein
MLEVVVWGRSWTRRLYALSTDRRRQISSKKFRFICITFPLIKPDWTTIKMSLSIQEPLLHFLNTDFIKKEPDISSPSQIIVPPLNPTKADVKHFYLR